MLINDKKYACDKCIKGHRAGSCTHGTRPLFEIKKKGRPVTQCEHCRKLRTEKQVHAKCECANRTSSGSSTPLILPNPNSNPAAAVPPPAPQPSKDPSTAAFPNGLRDVHAMNEAADALNALVNQNVGGDLGENKMRRVDALLNPCKCYKGGMCKCCQAPANSSSSHRGSSPSRSVIVTPIEETTQLPDYQFPAPPIQPQIPFMGFGVSAATGFGSGTTSPAGIYSGTRNNSTDNLAEMFRLKATTQPNLADKSMPASYHLDANAHSSITPSTHHHPAHTSRHVHKTQLYAPYSTGHHHHGHSNHNKSEDYTSLRRRSSSKHRSDRSGSCHHELPVTLPRIRETETEQTVDVTLPAIFPTVQALDIDGCTCGDTCCCPGCTTHPGNPGSTMKTETGNVPMEGVEECPSNCNSCFDCRSHATAQPGIQNIQQLIDIAAAHIPPPALRTPYTPYAFPSSSTPAKSPPSSIELDPLHMGVLPPAALWHDEAAAAMGLVKLKPLECCNGRCQCKPGDCTCMDDCCGCCETCGCGPGDGDINMDSGVSGEADGTPATSTTAVVDAAKSCCAGDKGGNPLAAEVVEPMGGPDADQRRTSTVSGRATPVSNGRASVVSIASSDTPGAVSRANSIGRARTPKSCCAPAADGAEPHHEGPGMDKTISRRLTHTGAPPAIAPKPTLSRSSSSKGASKHSTTGASHLRPILPRPSAGETQSQPVVRRPSPNASILEEAVAAAETLGANSPSTASSDAPAAVSTAQAPAKGSCCASKNAPTAPAPAPPSAAAPNGQGIARTSPLGNSETTFTSTRPPPISTGNPPPISMNNFFDVAALGDYSGGDPMTIWNAQANAGMVPGQSGFAMPQPTQTTNQNGQATMMVPVTPEFMRAITAFMIHQQQVQQDRQNASEQTREPSFTPLPTQSRNGQFSGMPLSQPPQSSNPAAPYSLDMNMAAMFNASMGGTGAESINSGISQQSDWDFNRMLQDLVPPSGSVGPSASLQYAMAASPPFQNAGSSHINNGAAGGQDMTEFQQMIENLSPRTFNAVLSQVLGDQQPPQMTHGGPTQPASNMADSPYVAFNLADQLANPAFRWN